MKIIRITFNNDVYTVTFKPNFIQRIFGYKEKDIQYKQFGVYNLGHNGIYVTRDGNIAKNFSKVQEIIDKYQRQW